MLRDRIPECKISVKGCAVKLGPLIVLTKDTFQLCRCRCCVGQGAYPKACLFASSLLMKWCCVVFLIRHGGRKATLRECKIGGTILGVLMLRIIVFMGLH